MAIVHAPIIKSSFRQQPELYRRECRLPNKSVCSWCGKSPAHGRHACPARDVTCHKCSKKGHYVGVEQWLALLWIERNLNFLMTEMRCSSEPFTPTQKLTTARPWVVKLSFNREVAEFKIDTGADVTVVPSEMYSFDLDGPLKRPTRLLSGPDKSPLAVKGSFTTQLERGDKTGSICRG